MCKSIPPLLPTRFRFPTMAALGFAAITLGVAAGAQAKPFMDYIKKTPTVAPLSSATWGVAGVIPRDISNGIESAPGAGVHPDYYYWDGKIIRAKDGKFHMFMSTFSGNTNFGTGWLNSDAYHAISDTNVLGPYKRQDFVYTDGGSHKGHNVSAVELPDGTYAVVVSEVVPFTIYKSASLDGPWTKCSPTSGIGGSNISLFPRHDGKFQITERNGTIAISDTLCGNYVKQKPTCTYTQNDKDAQGNPVSGSVFVKRTSIPNVSNPTYGWQEDPHIFRSGGTYHIIYSGSGDRVGWHVYSADGLTNWKDNGYAWSPREYAKIFCYEGSTTCTQWYKMERPSVVLQDGHPTHVTWAVADVDKDNQVLPGTNHGTKVIVVPFDGIAFDNDFGVGGFDAGIPADTATERPAGTGGNTGSDGAVPGTGGVTTGGVPGAGGSPGSGGVVVDGGRVDSLVATGGGTAGSVSTGGISMNAGGALPRTGGSTGGTVVVSTGGSSASGGSATGGVVANTGGSAAGGQAGSTAKTGGAVTPANPTSSGCSCSLQGRASTPGGGVLLLLGLVLIPAFRRRRSGQAK